MTCGEGAPVDARRREPMSKVGLVVLSAAVVCLIAVSGLLMATFALLGSAPLRRRMYIAPSW